MKLNEFYSKYANTSLKERSIKLEGSSKTLQQIYERLREIGDKIRPSRIEEEKLLKEAEWGFIKLEEKNE